MMSVSSDRRIKINLTRSKDPFFTTPCFSSTSLQETYHFTSHLGLSIYLLISNDLGIFESNNLTLFGFNIAQLPHVGLCILLQCTYPVFQSCFFIAASKARRPYQFSGKITVKAKEKSYSKLEIPYQAEVLEG